MEILKQPFDGLFVCKANRTCDNRGSFSKLFSDDIAHQIGMDFSVREEFVSRSKKNVVRGMHFQIPPHECKKTVFCLNGAVLDVSIDLRLGSKTYGEIFSIEISKRNRLVLWIPTGIAHGFLSLSHDSILIYKTNQKHSPSHDLGVLWNSIGFNWPLKSSKVILSDRDAAFPRLENFNTPFCFNHYKSK